VSVAPRTVVGNLAGAAFAAYLLLPNLRFFLHTLEPIGLVFAIQQAWVGAVFLLRRAPQRVSRHPVDWLVAYAAWFISFLVRPGGDHAAWASSFGLSVQLAGLALWAWAFAFLARSYGIVPADRGLVTRGPYALVRHPLYAAYVIGGAGYLMRSFSGWNVLVDATAVGLQLIRITREERHLGNRAYADYCVRVPWRLVPHVW
jgi:protein-S-isoprenylcysteine O-methyltransferase Ste14